MAKIDWDIVRAEYIKSNPKVSYPKLAEKYGVSIDVLTKRAVKENWTEQRQEKSRKRAEKIDENLDLEQEEEAKEIAEIKKFERKYAQLMQKAAIHSLLIGDKFNPDLTPQEKRSLSLIFKDSQDVLYRSYGIPDKHEIMGKDGKSPLIIEFSAELKGLAEAG